MAQLTAAFGSSHSVMLTCQLEDWQRGFKVFDLKGRYFDRKGDPVSYDELLAMAPPNAAELVTDEAIATRFQTVRNAIARMKADVLAAKLDVLFICGDDQHEFFSDDLMPPIVIYYGDTILNPKRKDVPDGKEAWYKRAQSLRQEEHGDAHYPVDKQTWRCHLITGLTDKGFDITSMRKTPEGQYEGHAFFIHRFYLTGQMTPIVPIMLNTYYPPNSADAGALLLLLAQAMREPIESLSEGPAGRFAASGGLSHFQAEEDLDDSVIDALAPQRS